MAGVSVRLTKSVIVMCSLAAISLLSLVLPAIMVNTLVYFIIAAGVGLPMATVLLGEYLLLKPFFVLANTQYIHLLQVTHFSCL